MVCLSGEKTKTGDASAARERLNEIVALLKEKGKDFRVAELMAEGLVLASNESNTLRSSYNQMSGRFAAVEKAAKEARQDADTNRESFGRLESSMEQKSADFTEKANQLSQSQGQVEKLMAGLKVRSGDKEYTGGDALKAIGNAVSGIPSRVEQALKQALSGNVTVNGETVSKEGMELIEFLISENGTALEALGEALRQNEELKGALASLEKKVDFMAGMIGLMLEKSGITISDEEREKIMTDSEENSEEG